MSKQIGSYLTALTREDKVEAAHERERVIREHNEREAKRLAKCPVCHAPMRLMPASHDCIHDHKVWRLVYETSIGDGMAVVSNFDPEVWAVWCRGVGITELIPRALVPGQWSEVAYRDLNFDPNEKPFRGRDPFAFNDKDPFVRPIVSFAALREGLAMKGVFK